MWTERIIEHGPFLRFKLVFRPHISSNLSDWKWRLWELFSFSIINHKLAFSIVFNRTRVETKTITSRTPYTRGLATFCFDFLLSPWQQIRVVWTKVKVRESFFGFSLLGILILAIRGYFVKCKKKLHRFKQSVSCAILFVFSFSFPNKTVTNESWISKKNCKWIMNHWEKMVEIINLEGQMIPLPPPKSSQVLYLQCLSFFRTTTKLNYSETNELLCPMKTISIL